MFNLDLGNDSSSGPFLAWSALGTRDGLVPARNFYIRSTDGKKPYDASNGIVFDMDALKTGWQHSEGAVGVPPTWKWNPTVSQMMPKPGDDYKKGFSVPVAIGGGESAVFEQAGASVWQALEQIAPILQQRPDAKSLPMLRHVDSKFVQFNKGSTVVPVFELVKWVDRPDCLKEGAAAGIATEPAPAPQPAPQPAPAPAPAATATDVEF